MKNWNFDCLTFLHINQISDTLIFTYKHQSYIQLVFPKLYRISCIIFFFFFKFLFFLKEFSGDP